MRLRIATVLVGHERDSYVDAAEKVDLLMKSTCPDAIRTTVIVDNAQPRIALEQLAEDLVIIGGDNTYREFSAWDRGLAHLDRTRENPDLIHFVTSAFDALYSGYLEFFSEDVLALAQARNCAVGHLDYYDEPIEVLGRESQSWIRTSYFFMPARALRRLRAVTSVESAEDIFSGDPGRPFMETAPLSEKYREYILSWLTGEGTGQGVTWHSRFDLSEETLPLFRAKALAILNEHMLTIRLREAGVAVCDIAWLTDQIRSVGGAEVGLDTDWEGQLKARRIGPTGQVGS